MSECTEVGYKHIQTIFKHSKVISKEGVKRETPDLTCQNSGNERS